MAGTGDGVGITQRVADVTLAKWTKKVSDLCVNKFAFTAALEKKKKIKYGQGGGEMRWPIRWRDLDISGHVDMGIKTAQRTRTTDNAYLGWRGFDTTEAISLMEKLQNRGPAAVVEIFKSMAPDIRRGLMRQLGLRWHKDGDSTAGTAENRFHGIESFGSSTTQTASDVFATTLNDTYAGKSTSYTAFKSGAVKGTDEEYGVWSPVIVNCALNPGSGIRTWASYADEYLRRGILEAGRDSTEEEQLDLILLNKDAYYDLLNLADDKERLVFDRGDPLGLVSMGFRQFLNLDGCMIGWDFGVPTTNDASETVYGYGYNLDHVELNMLNNKSMWELITTWNNRQAADEMYFYSFGNLKFTSPKYHAMFKIPAA